MNMGYIISSILSSFCSFSFGLNLTSIELIHQIFKDCEPEKNSIIPACLKITETNWSMIVSFLFLGALASNFIFNFSWMNKKYFLILDNILLMLGTLLIVFSPSIYLLYTGRFIVGMGCGIACSLVPLYLGEISPPEKSGFFGFFHQLFILIGILTGQILSFYFCKLENWRYGLMIILIFYALHSISLIFIQKSAEIKKIHNDSKNKEPEPILPYITAILFHSSQQLCGINSVLLFSNSIFEDTKNPKMYTVFLGIVSLISTIISMAIVDKYGRKTMILTSSFIVCISLFGLKLNNLPVFFAFLFMFGYSMGLGPIPWVITCELFKPSKQEKASKIAVATNWISSFLVASTFSTLHEYLGNNVFLIYLTIILGFCIFIGIYFK